MAKKNSKETGKAVKKVLPKKDSAQSVYIGPNIAEQGLVANTVFKGLPENIKAMTKKCQALGRLFVPVESLALALEQKERSGSGLARDMEMVKQFNFAEAS